MIKSFRSCLSQALQEVKDIRLKKKDAVKSSVFSALHHDFFVF
jgi:hypothetical protein